MAFITVESFPARPALTATLAAALAAAGEGINPEPGLTWQAMQSASAVLRWSGAVPATAWCEAWQIMQS